MLISHSRPSVISWSLLGAGAAFLTSADALDDGRPGSATRIQWLSGSQTTSSVLTLRGAWSSGQIQTGLIGIVGTTLPVGLRIVGSLRFDLTWGYSEVEGTVIEREDGVRVAWFIFPEGIEATTGIEFQIYNDVDGVTGITADSTFDIGEAWGGACDNWCIRPSYQSSRQDLSVFRQSLYGQPFPVRRRAMSTSQIELSPVSYDSAYGAIGTTREGVAFVRNQLLGYQPCVVVPMPAKPFTNGTTDMDYVNRHAEFGYCRNAGPIVGEAPRFVFSAEFTAPPPILPA